MTNQQADRLLTMVSLLFGVSVGIFLAVLIIMIIILTWNRNGRH